MSYQDIQTLDDNIEKDKFAGPIPGQSLTDEPGSRAWERPPEITDPDEAVFFVLEKFEKNEKVQSAYSKLMLAGMPIESIVNTITFGGFVEGKWTVDIAELMKPPLMSFFIAYADEHQIPYRVFNNPSELKRDDISDEQTLTHMADRNPKAFQELHEGLALQAQDTVEKNQGFLGSPPAMDVTADVPIEETPALEEMTEQEIG